MKRPGTLKQGEVVVLAGQEVGGCTAVSGIRGEGFSTALYCQLMLEREMAAAEHLGQDPKKARCCLLKRSIIHSPCEEVLYTYGVILPEFLGQCAEIFLYSFPAGVRDKGEHSRTLGKRDIGRAAQRRITRACRQHPWGISEPWPCLGGHFTVSSSPVT